jgi:hypothetical protein
LSSFLTAQIEILKDRSARTEKKIKSHDRCISALEQTIESHDQTADVGHGPPGQQPVARSRPKEPGTDSDEEQAPAAAKRQRRDIDDSDHGSACCNKRVAKVNREADDNGSAASMALRATASNQLSHRHMRHPTADSHSDGANSGDSDGALLDDSDSDAGKLSDNNNGNGNHDITNSSKSAVDEENYDDDDEVSNRFIDTMDTESEQDESEEDEPEEGNQIAYDDVIFCPSGEYSDSDENSDKENCHFV